VELRAEQQLHPDLATQEIARWIAKLAHGGISVHVPTLVVSMVLTREQEASIEQLSLEVCSVPSLKKSDNATRSHAQWIV
jgi:hypothetical protein